MKYPPLLIEFHHSPQVAKAPPPISHIVKLGERGQDCFTKTSIQKPLVIPHCHLIDRLGCATG